MFLRHEGFLGALGAFRSYEKHGLDELMAHQLVEQLDKGVHRTGDNLRSPLLEYMNENGSIECRVQLGN